MSNVPHVSYRWLPRKPKRDSRGNATPRAMVNNFHLPRPKDASVIVNAREAKPAKNARSSQGLMPKLPPEKWTRGNGAAQSAIIANVPINAAKKAHAEKNHPPLAQSFVSFTHDAAHCRIRKTPRSPFRIRAIDSTRPTGFWPWQPGCWLRPRRPRLAPRAPASRTRGYLRPSSVPHR